MDNLIANLWAIQVGDNVIVSGGLIDPQKRVDTITKVSKTRITISNGTQYTRKHGRQIGGNEYHCRWIHPASNEEIAKVKAELHRAALTRALSKVRWDRFPTEMLEKLYQQLLGQMEIMEMQTTEKQNQRQQQRILTAFDQLEARSSRLASDVSTILGETVTDEDLAAALKNRIDP
jgi:hypothetical protein